MGIMKTTKEAKAAYDRLKKWKKTAKEYYQTAKNLLDEDTRSGEIFKQGLKYAMKLAEKYSGLPLTKHPYFEYHKKHLEILVGVMTASDTSENAMKALHQAVSAADSAAVLATQIKDLNDRKNRLKLFYVHFLEDMFETYKNLSILPTHARADLMEMGMSEADLRAEAEGAIYAYRAAVAELFFDSLNLLAMVDTEYRAAEAAHKRFTSKLKKLSGSTKTHNFVAGKATEYQRDLETALRAGDDYYGRSAPGIRHEAIQDPSLYAMQKRDLVEDVVNRLARFCDTVMISELIYPVSFKLRTSDL